MGNTTATCSDFRGPPEVSNKALKKFDPRYKPVRVIGRGQFSTVYECVRDAVTPGQPRRYALKVMTCWTWDSRTLSRIEDEISMMQHLLYDDDGQRSHPCLVKLVDYFKERIPFTPAAGSGSHAAGSDIELDLQQPQLHTMLQLHPTTESSALPAVSQCSNGNISSSAGATGPLQQQSLPTSRQEGTESARQESLLLQRRGITGTPQRIAGNTFNEIKSRGSLAASQLTAGSVHAKAADPAPTSYMWRIGLVLDYCDGGDLAEYLNEKGPLPEAEARYIVCKIPENILLGKTNGGLGLEVKISDFGLAKELKGRVHRSVSLCGSDFYLPPEMLQQEPYDTQVDMWSMGTLCFAILFGSTPFSAGDLTTLYQQIIERRLFLSAEQE